MGQDEAVWGKRDFLSDECVTVLERGIVGCVEYHIGDVLPVGVDRLFAFDDVGDFLESPIADP